MVWIIAATSALAVFIGARALYPPPQRLAVRTGPYAQRIRARLGTTVPQRVAGGSRSVWGPLVAAAASGLATVVDASRSDDLELRLRQAGLRMTAEDYRRRQLAYTVTGLTVGLLLALLLQLSSASTLLVTVSAGLFGLTRWRATIERRITTRRSTMRAEAHTLAQLLAVYMRTGDTPIGALERLVERTSGFVSDELAAAVARIRSGEAAAAVFDDLAETCAEPAAARLYRLYGATWTAAGDPDALLALAEDLRSTRREDLGRMMAKRRTAMAIPLVLVLGPILILFIAAPLPSLIFDR